MCRIMYQYAEGFSWKTAIIEFETYKEYVEWYNSYIYGNEDACMTLCDINKD